MKIKIGHLYPDLLNLYADRGNILALKKRIEWRGMECEVLSYHLGDTIPFSDLDIVLLGGGSDREQRLVCDELYEKKGEMKAYLEDNRFMLGICGGYQLLGDYYQIGEDKLKGLSLIDMHTIQKEGRLIGNILLENEAFAHPIVGFENHGGRSYSKEAPFGKVICGYGNNGEDGMEGVLRSNLIGTYLHGPLLPKNPHITDYCLAQVIDRKYGKKLEPLDDNDELRANEYMKNQILLEFKKGK